MKHIARCMTLVAGILALSLLGAPPTPRADAQVPATNSPVTLTAFQHTVALVGTPTLLSSAANAPAGYVRQVALTALSTNTGVVEVRTASGTAGFQLQSGGMIVLPVQQTLANAGIYIRVSVNGEGVSAIAWTDR